MDDPSDMTNTPKAPTVGGLESILNDPLRVSDGDLPPIIGVGGQATHTNLNEDLDDTGKPFDPAIHDPAKRKNVRGEWAGKRGRKSGSPAPQMRVGGQGAGGVSDRSGTALAPNGPPANQYAGEAAAAVGLFTGGLATLLGEHWLPDAKSGELATLVETTRQAMIASGQEIKLPWYGPLIGATAMYAIPRFPHPTTKTRLAGIVGAVRGWWSKTFKRPKKEMGTTGSETDKSGSGTVDRRDATVTASVPTEAKPFWANS